jgi:hypothetical protein
LVSAIAAGLFGCGPSSVAELDCDEVADLARKISQDQPVRIANYSMRAVETVRSPEELRCVSQAMFSDGEGSRIYLRAYREDGNLTVAFQKLEPDLFGDRPYAKGRIN